MYEDLPKTRGEAKALGVIKYYTGTPCKHGHLSIRYVSSGCGECNKIKNQKHGNKYRRNTNQEKRNKRKREYYQENRESILEKKKTVEKKQ